MMEERECSNVINKDNLTKPQCAGCTVNIAQFVNVSNDLKKTCQFLADHGVISAASPCYKCGRICHADYSRLEFRCNRVRVCKWPKKKKIKLRCNARKSLFSGTWFMCCSLGVQKTCRLVFLWLVLPTPQYDVIVNELHLSTNTICSWLRNCRQICQESIWLSRASEQLGGEGLIVELDSENLSCEAKHKNPPENWLIGGYQRETDKCFIECIFKINTESVQSAVRTWVLPGTTLLTSTKQLYLYEGLEEEGYIIQSVKCIRKCVDPITGHPRSSMQNLWHDLRCNIPQSGRRREQLSAYIAEFIFKRRYPSHIQRVHAFFTRVAELHPPESWPASPEASPQVKNKIKLKKAD